MTTRAALKADRQGNSVIAKALESGAPIAVGANQRAVRWMERMLKLAGFNPGTQDNLFDAKTQRALKAFQSARGLPATGQLDKRTFEHLKVVQTRVRAHAGKPYFATGQKSGFVKVAEERLRKLGYDTGKADGVFDKKTAAAMKAFKADEGLRGASVLTQRGMDELRHETSAVAHAPFRGRTGKDLSAHKRLDALTAKAAAAKREEPVLNADGTPKLDADGQPVTRSFTGIGAGAKGRAVKNLQWHLNAAGFNPGRQDGVFDGRTEAMLKAFQQKSGMKATGRAGPRTWAKLARSVIYSKSDGGPAQRLGEKSAAVLRSEKLLKKLGFNPGKVDGLFDRNTLKASRAFERMQGSKVDGAIGTGQINQMKKALKGVTLSQLHRIMPALPMDKARRYLPLLNRAMAEAHINTRKRKAMFLAQLAHESVQLKYFEEIASGAAYEGRTDLGNTHPGDGVRYKGRGPIQLTGRANYRAAGKALGLPLEAHPKMAARPSVGFRTAAWFWRSHGLNAYADRGDFRGVTLRINGGYNGYSSRLAYYRRALAVL